MPLDSEQLKQGLRALYGFIASKAASAPSTARLPLFEEDEFIYLQISLKKTPAKASTKPARIPLQHSLYAADTECCLIIKDPERAAAASTSASSSSSSAGIKEYFAAHPVPGLTRILTVHKLRSEYSRFKDRRELLQLYDLFLADDRVLPVLPAVLGSKFFDKKKQPMPVDLRLRDKAREVQAALSSTAMFVPAGSCLVLRVGRTSFSRQQVEDNVAGCVEAVVHRLPGKWRNVQMVGLKTRDSITIPVYASLPLQEIKGAPVHNNGLGEETEDDDGMDDGEEGDGEAQQATAAAAQERQEEGEGKEDEPPVSATQRKRKRDESGAGREELRPAPMAAAASPAVVTMQRGRSSTAAQQPPQAAKQSKTESAPTAPAAPAPLAVAAAGKKVTTPTAVSTARKAAALPLSPRVSARQPAAEQRTASASAIKKRRTEEQAAASTAPGAAGTEAASSRKIAAGREGRARSATAEEGRTGGGRCARPIRAKTARRGSDSKQGDHKDGRDEETESGSCHGSGTAAAVIPELCC